MAYAALTSLADVILQILPHEQRYISLCGKDQMKSLHENVSLLQDFLEYISFKTFLPDIDAFESRMRDTAYKMEDTIELAILSDPGKVSKSEVQLPAPDGFSKYFQEFHVLLEETMEMRENIDNNAMPGKQPLTTNTLSREAPGSKGTKVGLDEALNQILDQVIGQKPPLRIVPITGMGGIGKTTLARASYEAPEILRHFDVRLWVTVSQDYNIQEILQGLLPKAGGYDERLIELVHKRLKGRRYLIVLDDMWDEKVWDRVRIAFPDDNNSSRVIVTTRSSGVASCVGSLNSGHEMQFMNEDQSWDEKITTSNDHLFEILSWSYNRLPPHLKACFLYMGTYKEDYEIKTKELVMIWAAEGFLKPKQCRSMEEAAEECLEELVQRSLVLVTKRWYNGKIRTCGVHDVLRELSIRKAEEEKFHYHFTQSVDESTFRNVLAVQRRVSITDCSIDNFSRDIFFATTHSLIDQKELSTSWMSTAQCFKLLRVLKKTYIEEDSELSILCTLTNLRYLHLVCDVAMKIIIPESISELQNLETLIFQRPRGGTVFFPLEIWKLQSLRHIHIGSGVSRVPAPNHDCLSLQTLYGVTNMNCTKSLIEKIPNMKKLKLDYHVCDGEDETNMENLEYLHQLEELSVNGDYYNTYTYKIVFPHNLKKLSLFNTRIPFENMSPIGLLPNLKVLKLKWESVVGNEWEPNEGEFLQLEHLKMKELYIKHWGAESIHFPCLRKLVIWDCVSLEEIPESIGEIDTLEKLIVRTYGEEVKRSMRRIKDIQQEIGNHLLQVCFG